MPLSRGELEAEKDSLRAEYAMTVRRLEIDLEAVKEQASELRVEVGRYHERVRALCEEGAEKDKTIGALEDRVRELDDTLAERDRKLEEAASQLEENRNLLDKQAREIDELNRLYEEASFTSSSRQIELVARESEMEELSEEINALRGKYRDAEREMRQAVADRKRAEQTLRTEKKRSADLEAKLERMMATLSDRDERLERREKELAALRERTQQEASEREEMAVRPEAAGLQSEMPESELAGISASLSGGADGETENALRRISSERDRLEASLTALVRQGGQVHQPRAGEGGNSDGREEERPEDAALREQISDLAAEVVYLAARLEGPDSPVSRALAEAQVDAPDDGGHAQDRITSLAERIRALQQSEAAGPS